LRKIDKNLGLIVAALFGAVLVMSSASWTSVAAQSSDASTVQLTKRLFSAVNENNLATVRSSITAGANITAMNSDGMTAAGLAIEKGYFNIAHYILGVRNQRVATEEDGTRRPNESLPSVPQNAGINIPSQSPPPQIQTPSQVKAPPPQRQLPPQAVTQWPAGKPNPFAPDANSGTMPIVGKLQKPTVQPELPNTPVKSKIKEQTPQNAPLKTASTPPTRKTIAPTPIKPLAKETVTVTPVIKEEQGMFGKMVDGVTGVFTPDRTSKKAEEKIVKKAPEPSPAKAPETKAEEADDQEDGVLGRMWHKITNIF
jgi:hypothetical protein